MCPPRIDRRSFLGALGVLGLATVAGCGGGRGEQTVDRTHLYRLSTRGRRASNAAKKNAANKLFVSPAAAEAGRAHPNDTSRVVRIEVAESFWMAHFGAGQTSLDLRDL